MGFKEEFSAYVRAGYPLLYVTASEPERAVSSIEKLSDLKPAFRKGGTVTAGNSSGINDGAAAILMLSKERSEEKTLSLI